MKPKTEMAVMREMLRERQRMLATQAKQLAAANELLSSVRRENCKLAERLAAANEQIAAMTEIARHHGLTPQSSKSPLGYLSSLITGQKREIEQLRKEREFLRTQAGLVETDDILKAISQYKHVQQEIATLKAQIEQLRAENRKLALAVASQTMRIAELERQPEAWSGYHDVTDLYENPAEPEQSK